MPHVVRIWDLPTRLFHWLLAIAVVGLVITGQLGGAAMVWHFRLGYAVLTLLLFRLVWGLVGGYWSRFASFIYTPAQIRAYLRGQGQPEHSAGHNPLGAFSVFGLLLILLVQVLAGLFSDDEIASAGPLTKFASGKLVSTLTWYHADVGKVILIVLVILHVAAIVFYRLKKNENLVTPMLLGDKTLNVAVRAARDDWGSRALALAVLAICTGVVYWIVSLGG